LIGETALVVVVETPGSFTPHNQSKKMPLRINCCRRRLVLFFGYKLIDVMFINKDGKPRVTFSNEIRKVYGRHMKIVCSRKGRELLLEESFYRERVKDLGLPLEDEHLRNAIYNPEHINTMEVVMRQHFNVTFVSCIRVKFRMTNTTTVIKDNTSQEVIREDEDDMVYYPQWTKIEKGLHAAI
jgi:hypothetical protein